MSFNKKEDRLKSAWIWIGFAVFVFGVVLFTIYGVKLGAISHDHTAWSSFGSLLGGFFMIASTGATVATLFFLAHQNKEIQRVNVYQREVTQAQLAAMNFEQYINHRRLFMDRLVELQTSYENKFVFVDGESLYNKIFTKNGPTNLVFKVDLDDTEDGENLLRRIGTRLDRLDKFLDQSQWNHNETRKLVGMLIDVYGDLQIRWTGEAFDGDVMFFGKHTGVNIYSLDDFLAIARSIYNSLLFYTGNKKYDGLNKSMMRYPCDALIEFFLEYHKLKDAIDVVKIIPGLAVIERLYLDLESFRGFDSDWLLKSTYSSLLDVFRSKEHVRTLKDDVFMANFVSVAMKECALALETVGEEGDNYPLLLKAQEEINSLHSRY
ncbi:hypothetical protein [Pseudomonas moraviensis]|uniref:hypothetical protein n=1 Tax=Pseudomonas moraviensis TaxID=321662 RepID=UPI00087A9DD9|nr:hypothetical protein [Pseudomonas moraviensis]SDU29429.1 hypothetical protein SAMN04490196_1387 [Pseudomonas moraviensis]